jgi:aminoglycoside 2''-phosphotransferase
MLGSVPIRSASRTVSGIIDFGDLAIGDPAWDFVYIYEDYGLDFLRRALHAYEPSEPRPLVERMYAFYILDLIEWVAQSAENDDPELGAAIAELSRVRTDEEWQRADLFRVLS